MSAPLSTKPSGIKPPTSRLVRPTLSSSGTIGRPSISNGSGDSGRRPSEDVTKKKISDATEAELVDVEDDIVGDLPALPGSRKNSEHRRLSDGSGNAVDAAYEMARRLSEAGVRRMSDASIILTSDTDSFIVGERVYVNGMKAGSIQYIGETKFAPGEWAGIVLDDFSGKNDGSVAGVRYFQCQAKKGVFSRLTRLTREPLDAEQLASIQQQTAVQQQAALKDSTNDSEGSLLAAARQTSPPPGGRQSSPSPAGTPSMASSSIVSVQSIGDLHLGDRVIVTSTQGSKAGTLRFLGNTEFATGQWAGVELDDPVGKNDGAVAGTRYFDCQAMYGLFAPVHKVSRSPANTMGRRSSGMNTSMTTSRQGGLVRQGTRDSMGSSASVISNASRASTALSRVRSIANPRLGVASLTNSNSPTDRSKKASRPSAGGGTSQGGLQDLIREKEQHIEQLLKEREMERCEVTRAAAQADEAEHQLALLQRRYQEEKEEAQKEQERLEGLLTTSEASRASQAAQMDDLQFRLEESEIMCSEMESQNKIFEAKEKDLLRQLEEERARAEQLENEAQRSFEAEEQAARCKDEVDALMEQLNQSKAQVQQLESERTENASVASDSEIALKSRIQELEAATGAQSAEYQKLKGELEEMSRAANDLREKCRIADERGDGLVLELDGVKQSLQKVEESRCNEEHKRKETETQLDKYKTETSELKKQMELIELQSQQLAADKSKIESELLQLSSSSSDASQDLTRLHTELLAARQSISELQSSVAKLEQEKCDLQSRLAQADELTTSLKCDVDNKLQLVGDLTNAKEKLEKELAALKQREVDLLNSVQNLESEIQKSSDEVSSLRAKTMEMEREGVKMNEEVSTLLQKVALLESNEVKSKEEAVLLQEKIVGLESNVNKSTEEITLLVAKIADLETSGSESRGEADSLRQTILTLEAEKNQWLSEKPVLDLTIERLNGEVSRLTSDNEHNSKEIQEREARLILLTEQTERLRNEFDAHRTELQGKLQETRKEVEAVHELHATLEKERFRADELQVALEESELRCQKQEESFGQEKNELVKKLEEEKMKTVQLASELKDKLRELTDQLTEKQKELQEEMEDRDKAENRLIHMESSLSEREKELQKLREEMAVLQQKTSDSSRLLSAYTSLEKEKRNLEEKIVELQVAAARSNSADTQTDADSRVQELKRDYEMSQREINFLNSVIVDMQKKVDDMKIQLEVSQATLYGQNINENNHSLNGIKTNVVTPRLFCDICDLFDLHDTEDCPKQASDDMEMPLQMPATVLSPSSPAYKQHSHHGGKRGDVRPYCEICEIFGHATEDCDEEQTY